MTDDTAIPCVIDDCDTEAAARGLCRPHYMHYRKLGELDKFPKRRPGPKPLRDETPAERERRRYAEGAHASAPHGTLRRYAKGKCRCEPCRLEGNRAGRERYARRKAAGLRGSMGNVENCCAMCGMDFKDKQKRVYCSMDCYRQAQGIAPIHGWWIHEGWRYKIYERDGWRCQLCGEPVDMCAPAHANLAPSLDHIVPRAHGGSDEPDNLRLAHRVCNSARGSRMEEASRVCC